MGVTHPNRSVPAQAVTPQGRASDVDSIPSRASEPVPVERDAPR